jgi:hypothetical protein
MDLTAPRPRPGPARCALCHDAAADGVITCAGCGTLTHDACRREAGGGCPTLGCELRVAPPEAPARPRRRERGVPSEIVFLTAAFGFFWNASLTDAVDVALRWGCLAAGAACVALALFLLLDALLGPPAGWARVRGFVAPPSWLFVRAVLLRVVLPSIALMLLLGPCAISGQVI